MTRGRSGGSTSSRKLPDPMPHEGRCRVPRATASSLVPMPLPSQMARPTMVIVPAQLKSGFRRDRSHPNPGSEPHASPSAAPRSAPRSRAVMARSPEDRRGLPVVCSAPSCAGRPTGRRSDVVSTAATQASPRGPGWLRSTQHGLIRHHHLPADVGGRLWGWLVGTPQRNPHCFAAAEGLPSASQVADAIVPVSGADPVGRWLRKTA